MSSGSTRNWSHALSPGLSKLGWVEGRNLTIERRYADGKRERLAELASELVRLKVHVIVVVGLEAEAAQRATRSIPIVTMAAFDPVAAGFAKSLARPGGNMTGVLLPDPAWAAKSVQILKETLPGLRRLGLLYSAGPETEAYNEAIEAGAREMGVTVNRFPVASREGVSAALAAARNARVDALRVSYSGSVLTAEAEVQKFAAANKIPDLWIALLPVSRGGFMAYARKPSEFGARGAALVDKILKGAKPVELPFEYVTQYELVVNLKTAKQRGITVPQSILLRADRVIE